MKLVDILVRELKVWPEGECFAWQDYDREVRFSDSTRHDFFACSMAEDNIRYQFYVDPKSGVTRAEWQAAVDALNQSELDAVLAKNEQLAAARAERIPTWNGEGLPPVGAICEVLWNESRMEYLITKVFGVNEHGQPIHRFDEGPKKYQYQADVLRTASGTQVFRPIRTAEQVAAEEREKAIDKLVDVFESAALKQNYDMRGGIAAIYDAVYRKEKKPCGS